MNNSIPPPQLRPISGPVVMTPVRQHNTSLMLFSFPCPLLLLLLLHIVLTNALQQSFQDELD